MRTLTNLLARLGSAVLDALARLGRWFEFMLALAPALPTSLLRPRLIVDQLFHVGVLSLQIILVAGAFVGMVLGLQGYSILATYGSAESLGVVVALSLVRELGPVLTALLFAGRAGSALTAELGLMKSTEQLAGMEMMAVDPVRRVVAPRFWAAVLAMPLLAALFSLVGVLGGFAIGVGLLGVDSGSYWSQIQSQVDFHEDIVNGVIKSLVFGLVAAWIALYEGYDCLPTAEGVSRATTRTVVNTSLAVLGLDFIMTALMFN
ncbi:MAG TPA: lipid asymmetry maintenance ABC transporter permease subunit MlaE, partial [bacterium]|nr:lipid asymmetry maintenance ABC transporter permease subunit MlaE [bacterium]